MPAFLALVLYEKGYAWQKGKDNVNTADTISSLLSGITNVTKDVWGLALPFMVMDGWLSTWPSIM